MQSDSGDLEWKKIVLLFVYFIFKNSSIFGVFVIRRARKKHCEILTAMIYVKNMFLSVKIICRE